MTSVRLRCNIKCVHPAKANGHAQYLEEILRVGFSHPAVEEIIMFVGPLAAGFNVTTLADKNLKNTPAGDVVDKLLDEWNYSKP
ncbi:unnamed protein product [Prunus armeniaca]|uniref:Uncharacterized protein n=1 Tax=Prunus armeniaca TaxID=36596 RepID=A0A6J5VS17_PRUAR|nr:unnamed protein product [Prunus armeniaca]